MFREHYCLNNAGQCARFQIAKAFGLAQVPDLMLPSQNEWADQIIKERKSEQHITAARRLFVV